VEVPQVREAEVTRLLSIPGGAYAMLPEMKTLCETEPGDVFYLVGEPGVLWHRHAVRGTEDYDFTRLDGEAWWALSAIGVKGHVVVAVHNTIKFCRTPAELP
jgi:hypothetical protein